MPEYDSVGSPDFRESLRNLAAEQFRSQKLGTWDTPAARVVDPSDVRRAITKLHGYPVFPVATDDVSPKAVLSAVERMSPAQRRALRAALNEPTGLIVEPTRDEIARYAQSS